MATYSAMLPEAPTFSDQFVADCRTSGDYSPMLFEWYKFVGSLAALVAHIQRESPAYKTIARREFHVLIGLLNRCARLMLSNVALSHEGKFGETTAIIDRCIFESAIKALWLMQEPSDERFDRYFADGLRTELEFKGHIETNIAERGEIIPLETKMLRSIENTIMASEMSENAISNAKKLPDLAAIVQSLGLGRLIYVAAQKMGSHHVHGTWTSLLMHYLEERSEAPSEFAPRGHDCSTHINQYMFVSKIVLMMMAGYVRLVFGEEDAADFVSLFASTDEAITRVYDEAVATHDSAGIA